MERTKIVATLGPSCQDYVTLKKMVQAGLDVVRINLSHAKLDFMDNALRNIKKVRKELKVELPIMIDTRGPEIRVKTFANGKVQINKNQPFIFTTKALVGDENIVSINQPSLIKEVKIGNTILANDGLLTFKVVKVENNNIHTLAQNSGELANNKSLFIPNVKLDAEYLNKQDRQDILWAIKNDVELVAISFVNSKDDVLATRKFIEKNKGDLKIIAKVESYLGVKNLDEIIDTADGVMVARGDLGVEIDMEKLPHLQKQIIEHANKKGKFVITATEMLQSMVENPRPTRAEVSDVANSIYDGTSAIMLSGETASGKYPIDAVKMMSKIALETEKHLDYLSLFNEIKTSKKSVLDSVLIGAVESTMQTNVKALVVFTNSGSTALKVSALKPPVPILAITPNEKVCRTMSAYWGVRPHMAKQCKNVDEMFKIATTLAKKMKLAQSGDYLSVTCGSNDSENQTSIFKTIQIK